MKTAKVEQERIDSLEINDTQHGSKTELDPEAHKQWKVKMKKLIKAKATQDISNYPKRQQLYYIYRTIMNRRNFEYTFRHLLKYFLYCRNCKKNNSLKSGAAKRDLYLNRAIVKLRDDRSITKLLSRAQIVEEMQEILFNKSDRMLM